MIRLELEVSEMDLDSLVELYLPQFAEKLKREGNPLHAVLNPTMIKTLLKTMSQEKKEQLACELINGNSAKSAQMFEESAARRGVNFKINSAKATKI